MYKTISCTYCSERFQTEGSLLNKAGFDVYVSYLKRKAVFLLQRSILLTGSDNLRSEDLDFIDVRKQAMKVIHCLIIQVKYFQ